MTRYLPLIANASGALLIFLGSVAAVVLAFVHDPLLGGAVLSAGSIYVGRLLATVGPTGEG